MIIYTNPDDRAKQIKEFTIPDFFILSPELTIKLETFSVEDKNWHLLSERINTFLIGARKAYINSLLDASIFYSLCALEFSLKAKYCFYLYSKGRETEAEDYLIKKNSSFGEFINDENRLQELKITELKTELNDLKNLRDGLLHFNYEKLKEGIKNFGEDFTWLEKPNSFTDYTSFIDDRLCLEVFKRVTQIIKKIFIKQTLKIP